METITTLTKILKESGCEFRIHDLGRRIEPIANEEFERIELGQAPYPFPIQRQAQFAVSYWNEQQQPWIWFLKFDLDERGLLNSADMGNFIQFILGAMGARLQGDLDEETQQQLANNPYTFKPAEDKLAVFNSQIRAHLSLPASQYFEHTLVYLNGQLGWDNWQTVGLQGLADVCARLNQQDNERLLKKSLRALPTQPLYALLGALEHTPINNSLATRLYDMAQDEINKPQTDLFLLAALVRALAGDTGTRLSNLVEQILRHTELCHQEVLIAIAGRCWMPLQQPALAEAFLIRLAQTGNQALFNQLFADLVMLPKLRMTLLPMLHNAPSAQLANALLSLQTTTRGQA